MELLGADPVTVARVLHFGWGGVIGTWIVAVLTHSWDYAVGFTAAIALLTCWVAWDSR